MSARLDVTAELSHDEIAMFVRCWHGRLLGAVTNAPDDRPATARRATD